MLLDSCTLHLVRELFYCQIRIYSICSGNHLAAPFLYPYSKYCRSLMHDPFLRNAQVGQIPSSS